MKAKKLSEWKLFENFIGELERILAPSGARVKINDQVRDRNGSLRQVDATIRVPVGEQLHLTILECRNRKKISDVTWIEQVAGKRQSLGAVRAIVVSNRKLTSFALTAAKHFNVEVRKLDSGFPADMIMPKIREIAYSKSAVTAKNIQFRFFERYEDINRIRALTEDALQVASAELFECAKSGEKFSLQKLHDISCETAIRDPLKSCEETYSLDLAQNRFLLLNFEGRKLPVKSLLVDYARIHRVRRGKLEMEGKYSSSLSDGPYYAAKHAIATSVGEIEVFGVGDPLSSSLTFQFEEGKFVSDIFNDLSLDIRKRQEHLLNSAR